MQARADLPASGVIVAVALADEPAVALADAPAVAATDSLLSALSVDHRPGELSGSENPRVSSTRTREMLPIPLKEKNYKLMFTVRLTIATLRTNFICNIGIQ